MKEYLKLMDAILYRGVHRSDRTGAGTLRLFGPQLEFHLADGFPAVTTKEWDLSVSTTLGWPEIDQIDNLIFELRGGRLHIVTDTFQCYVADGALSLKMYQHCADYFSYVPFIIASHAFLLHKLADQTNLAAGRLIISFGDVYLCLNHLAQCHEQLKREPLKLPTLVNGELMNYVQHPAIKGGPHGQKIAGR